MASDYGVPEITLKIVASRSTSYLSGTTTGADFKLDYDRISKNIQVQKSCLVFYMLFIYGD